MPSDKSGPNICYELHSHRENMKNKKVSDRLNKLLQYNVLCDIQEGTYPTPGQLIMSTGFGRPSKNHSFTSDVHFDHVVLPLIKSGYLDAAQFVTLAKTSKLYAHLMITMERCVDINFRPLSKYNLKWKEQESIPHERVMMFLACAIYYDFNMAAIMRFVGNNYTAAYRNVPRTMQYLHEGNVSEDVCRDVERIFTVGCPSYAKGHFSRENFLQYKQYGNHKSVQKGRDLIKKAVNKEDKLNFAMPFPCWIARLVPHLHLTPNGIVVKPGKEDRLTYDGTIKLAWDSQPISDITDTAREPKIRYGTAFERHLIQIWNLRISYPRDEIYLWDDDVTGAFRQGKFNPEIVGAFSFILLTLLIIPCGLQFGCTFSPANFEPLAHAREQLAETLGDDASLLETHKNLLDMVQFDDPPGSDIKFTTAAPCSRHTGVFKPDGTRHNTKHNMFVDDNLMAEVRLFMRLAIVASIEALYRIFGRPQTEFRKSPLSMEKFVRAKCSHEKVQLGKRLNTRTMRVSMTPEMTAKLLKELDHWHGQRKSFTVRQGARLLGLLEHAATYVVWAKYLFYGLRNSIIVAVRTNRQLVFKNAKFRDVVRDSMCTETSPHVILKKEYATSQLARAVWNSNQRHFISKSLRMELKYLANILLQPEKFHWSSPIAHLIPRDPEFYCAGDACLTGAGGYSRNAHFWWFLAWPAEVVASTLKAFTVRVQIDIDKFISINLLEYATILINYAATSQALSDGLIRSPQPYPMVHIDADNTTAVSWTKKAVSANQKSKALSLVFVNLTLNNCLGVSSAHIAGDKNILPDLLSRINSSPSATTLPQIFQKFPWLTSCRQFHPSPALVSCLLSALLHGRAPGLTELTTLGHFAPAKNIG